MAIAADVPGAYAIAVGPREVELDDVAHTQRGDPRVCRVDELALVVMHARRERPRAGLAPRHDELAFAAAARPRHPVARLERERGSGVCGNIDIFRRGLAQIAAAA